MGRLIDGNALYEKTAEWEASALAYIEKLNRTPLEEMDEDEKAEWHRWTAILGERSAFKHDVADAPTIDAVEVVRCKDCRFHEQEEHGMVYCPNIVGSWVEDEWYCAGGERR